MGHFMRFERESKIFNISRGLLVPAFKMCIQFEPEISFLIIYLKEIRIQMYKYAISGVQKDVYTF